jgi:hypothetical protein
MTTPDRSNVAAEVAVRLKRAREYYDDAIDSYRAAADEILAAKKLDEKLSNRAIAKAMGLSHTTVGRLLDWRESGADRTTSPFGGDHKKLDRSLRQAIRERPDEVFHALAGQPDAVDLLVRAAADEYGELADPATEPAPGPPLLDTLDTVRMGEHILVVGDAERPGTKLQALLAAGLPHLKEFFDRDAVEEGSGDGEMDVVVVTDQPYGQGKRNITNDHRANWGPVYSLFKPRGGFVFCAYHPPFFREAEDGIIEAGGKPMEYLALDKGGGRMWGGDRVQNRLDAVIYFERSGAPWPSGRRAVSMLTPNLDRASRDERKLIGGAHGTPKYVDVLSRLIELCTEPGGLVLDPFAGSGTTLIACQRTGRRFIGVELEPEWADLTVTNWQRETGRDALVSREFGADGITFDALKAKPELGNPY